ncbi:MAG: glutathione S-transferase family protein [Burkholderiales bacterium]
MAITFYYGSGSPFSWKVWLALEHKQLHYELKLKSLRNGELKTPEFLAINPRGKVPVLVEDDGIPICESVAIVEYLEERYPEHPLLPGNPGDRALARRVAAEANDYLYPVLRRLLDQTLFRAGGSGDPALIAAAIADLRRELANFEGALHGDCFAGNLSVADFTLYPLLALVKRLHDKQPQHGAGPLIGPRFAAFMRHIEQLPFFVNTIPPHWKE